MAHRLGADSDAGYGTKFIEGIEAGLFAADEDVGIAAFGGGI